MKHLILASIAALLTNSYSAAADDDARTEAAAAICEKCTASQDNNDRWTDVPRSARREQAAGLTRDGGAGKPVDPQGTGSDH